MGNIDLNNTQAIGELLEQGKTDKNSAVKLLKLFSSNMLKEASLYIDDEETARRIVIMPIERLMRLMLSILLNG